MLMISVTPLFAGTGCATFPAGTDCVEGAADSATDNSVAEAFSITGASVCTIVVAQITVIQKFFPDIVKRVL